MLYQLSYIGRRAEGARNSRLENRNSLLIVLSPTFEFPFSNFEMERETGIEPATNSLEGCDSTTELLPPPVLKLENGNWKLAKFARYVSSFEFPVSIFQLVDRGGFEPP